MATWAEFEEAAPDLARFVRGRFEAHTLAFLATLRLDGAPRISGIETMFAGGHLLLGMMKDSLKTRDLARDPRLALHSASVDKDVKEGDVKLTGRAVAAGPAEFALLAAETGGAHDAGTADLWWVDLESVSSLRIGTPADHLVIESWRPGEAVKTVKRS
ncbi:MAG TPA: pyridoxamine 5'-phosphate oxidase family protein [Egibacteraceae bacterium]|nr:pyridoxamine 5'-phosphate oxidase family protein [Egibacteraceae bacterium]